MPDDVPLKRCPHCPEGQQWHPATPEFFYRSKNGLHSLCKDCKRSYEKSHRNLPEVKAHSHEWHKSYYQKHCSEIKEKNSLPSVRENHSARMKVYLPLYRSRPDAQDKKRSYDINRRAHKKAAPGTHTLQESKEQYQRQGGKCYWCQRKIEWGEHHEDHIIPLTRDGATNDISNIAIACPTCNRRKKNKLPHEFYEGGRLL
jgi:5-methylcytosine-specific restriction endonuclease McrA